MTAAVNTDEVFIQLTQTTEGRGNPYPLYRQLHEHAPTIFQIAGTKYYGVRGYAECSEVLRDGRLGVGERAVGQDADGEGDKYGTFITDPAALINLDPPLHTRLRRLVTKAFTKRQVDRMLPNTTSIADGLLDKFESGDVIDVIADLSTPLPVAVVGRMLNVPESDWMLFAPLMVDAVAGASPWATIDQLKAAYAASEQMKAYFIEFVADRKAHPIEDDLLTAILRAEENGERLAEDEVNLLVLTLFVAAFSTTAHLIGNGLYALLSNPDQLRILLDDRSVIPSAVEEFLRYDPPVQVAARSAHEDLEIAGTELPAGAQLTVLLAAGNRDPERFTDPDRLDVRRSQGPPLSFGGGIHHCLGASLARQEGQVFFDRLLSRFPNLSLEAAPARRDEIFAFRELRNLPVRLAS
ncbi:cytochrome P450 [Mycobacterium sp. TNTM28]|uniref:Cytochrome P450 n=1 Tax=[Mycobacterium] fortunisiensis TaxID=2600579 RepID=A0ABS6KIN4_9MYCO|nr:cytochrome P450 [[Mycobacterium] fortunisiensis]MBU9763436.1 cytochrome P450 [[Mycobacterium] fortunisiensis]